MKCVRFADASHHVSSEGSLCARSHPEYSRSSRKSVFVCSPVDSVVGRAHRHRQRPQSRPHPTVKNLNLHGSCPCSHQI